MVPISERVTMGHHDSKCLVVAALACLVPLLALALEAVDAAGARQQLVLGAEPAGALTPTAAKQQLLKAPATILGHNLFARLPVFAHRPLLRDRLCVGLVSLGGVAMAMWGKSLMELLDVALSIQLVALFVPVTMGIYGRPWGPLPAVLSMLLGFGAWLAAFTLEHLDGRIPEPVFSALTTIPSDFWGLGFAIVGYLLGQVLSRQHAVFDLRERSLS